MYHDNDVLKIIENYYDDIKNYRDSYKIIKKYFLYLYKEETDSCNISFERFKNILIEYKFNNYNLIEINLDNEKYFLLNIKFDFLYKYNIYKIKKNKKDNICLYLK